MVLYIMWLFRQSKFCFLWTCFQNRLINKIINISNISNINFIILTLKEGLTAFEFSNGTEKVGKKDENYWLNEVVGIINQTEEKLKHLIEKMK